MVVLVQLNEIKMTSALFVVCLVVALVGTLQAASVSDTLADKQPNSLRFVNAPVDHDEKWTAFKLQFDEGLYAISHNIIILDNFEVGPARIFV